MKKLLIISALLISIQGIGQDTNIKKYINSITLEEIKTHMEVIASDEYEGRGTGDASLDRTAEYLKKEFKSYNLTGPSPTGDPYYQEFELMKNNWRTAKITSGDQELILGRDFILIGEMPMGKNDYELVFLGYGIDEENYSDYKGIDVTGKVVAFFSGEPKTKDGRYLVSGGVLPKYNKMNINKLGFIKKNGAVAGIAIDQDEKSAQRILKMASMMMKAGQVSWPGSQEAESSTPNLGTPGVMTSPTHLANLFGVSKEKLFKTLKKLNKGKTQSGKFKANISIEAEGDTGLFTVENVVGYLEGTDLKDELVIVTAHYDHLGKTGDDIYNGADDNASGTIALLEAAEAFAQAAEDGIRPRRSILFMPVTAEEKGLYGSQYYANHPIFDLDKTYAELNMDMLGRWDSSHEDQKNYTYIYFSDTLGSPLHDILIKSEKMSKSDLIPELRDKKGNLMQYGGSDHASFERKGVPVVYYFNGTHKDYHRPSDTMDKINYENLTNISRNVFATLWELANSDEKIKN